MRRTVASDWIAGLIGAALVAALLLAGSQRANLFGALHAGFSLPGLFEAFIDLACPAAMAQEQLEFRPVPAESASRFDRMRVRRSTDREPESLPPVPPVPADPADPAIPGHPPGVTLGKSGSVMRIGSDIHVQEDEVIRGDLNTVGGDITIEGHVQGNVVAMRGDVTLTSTARVDGDVVCIGGTLHEESGAVVGGERVTAIGDERRRIRRESGGSSDTDRDDYSGKKVVASLVSLLLGLAIAWMFARFAPGRTAAAVETLRRDTAASIGVGALIWALVVPSIVALALVVALLCITIIGIPLALAALLGYALFLCVLMVWGYVVGAILLGGGLMRRQAVAAVAATPGSVAVSPAPTSAESTHALMERHALTGALVLGGAGVVASLFQSGNPLHPLGVMVGVLGKIATLFLITMGAGAWLRSELATGLLGRWWAGRRGRSGYGGPPPSGAPAPPPAPAPGPAPSGWSAPGAVPYTAPPPPPYTAPPATHYTTPPPEPAPPNDPSRFAPPPPPPPAPTS